MTKKTKTEKTPSTAYNQEFRDTAVKLALAGDKAIATVARELEIPSRYLYDWVKAAKKKKNGSAANSSSKSSSAEEELRRLQKRYKELETENEILKKAAA
jgi:transposase-like protein